MSDPRDLFCFLSAQAPVIAQVLDELRAVTLPGKDHMTAVGDPAYKQAVLEFLSAEAHMENVG